MRRFAALFPLVLGFWVLLSACPGKQSSPENVGVESPTKEQAPKDAGNQQQDKGPTHDEGPWQDRNVVEQQPVDGVVFSNPTMILESGERQRGELGKVLVKPIVARYIDERGNGVSGIEIVFTILAHLEAKQSITKKTDAHGRASVGWVLGAQSGFQGQRMKVQKKGSNALPITVVASGFRAGPPEKTKFSGFVINNKAQALVGVSVYLAKDNKVTKTVKTDKDGNFMLDGIKEFLGQAHLVVDGTTSPNKNEVYPKLEYEVFNISGIENRLDGPIPLPKLDPAGTVKIESSKTAEIRPSSIKTLRMVIVAGSATFKDKKKSGVINITQVDPYWIPMPFPSGFASSMIITVQPPSVRFDPPAPITFPNKDKLKAGALVPIFNFDHSKGRYVKVAMGRVSADGQVIKSLPGQGLVRGGWSGAGTPINNTNNQNTNTSGGNEGGDPNNSGTNGGNQNNGKTSTGGDPVLLHNGALTQSHRDLYIPGRGLHFQFTRSYNSRFQYNGPLGYNWDHNYHMRLELRLNGDAVLRNGKGRMDTFTWDQNGKRFISPPHYYDTLIRMNNGNYILKKPNGGTHIFLRAMRDRHGNQLQFEYSLKRRLITIIDTLGRPIRLRYTEQGRLKELIDYAGRKVSYSYDKNYDLVAVTSPATQRYPKGSSDARLNHNIISASNAKGEVYLTNKYDKEDRVIEQAHGPGKYTFVYKELNKGGDPKDLTLARSMSTMTNPVGDIEQHSFNINGNPLKVERMSRGLRPGASKSWVTSSTYNKDGRPIGIVYPRGNSTEYTYDTKNPDRRAHQNILKLL